ncbi:hypothetical protein FDH02_gp45 [Pseudomonas phage VSW-3]|uniref:Uncharacterized protein n=1 Tax=Pseudomonas phage VSW-3 TaxID=1852562 RepID=A0A173GCP6_9CAUD|nr:hypothetical protein FDH02_gp45 [Pseudomonas phage VSW-3]ANH51121.1 hypothetical protein VSW3_46 [Pseudomonas phage VSW-3]
MKFSTLAPSFRSALSALANVTTMRTDKLANVLNTDPQGAAHVLCQMRKLGLIFSMEKGTAAYAPWAITEVGMQLFANRPNHTLVYVTDEELALLEGNEQASQKITKYAVVVAHEQPTGTKKQAILCAQEAALRTGVRHFVIGLVADVTPPPQPEATVVLL